jgi:cobalt-precorrin-5B (C1)-methyltransferase
MGLSILLAGHPGKLAKVLEGYFQTHCSRSPPANNAVLKLLRGKVGDDVIEEMKGSPTVEGITAILQEHRSDEMINHIAEAIEERVKKYLSTDLPISILLFNMNRELIGASKSGEKWVKGYI